MSNAPIGIFDSGLGGLSVAREVRNLLPAEDILYLADTAFCPYGGRPAEQICARSLLVTERLLAGGAKATVVACNSASAAALEPLREAVDTPVIGLEPALKPAARTSPTGRVGIMATEATLRAERFDRLVENHGKGVQIFAQACPGLVEHVERGETTGPALEATLTGLLEPLRQARVDTIVLGCTHYPFLRDAITRLMGPEVRVMDSGAAVARQVERVLAASSALRHEGQGRFKLLTTGDAATVSPIAERLWGEELEVEQIDL